MIKSFKYRLVPTKSQRTKLNQTLKSCQWVYNKTIEVKRISWEQDKKMLSRYDTFNLIPSWRVENPQLNDVYVQVLRDACTRVDLAFQAFFRRYKNGEKPGYPRYKNISRYNSFTFTQNGFSLNGNVLELGKIGNIKIKLHRPIQGEIKAITIQCDNIGNWHACFSCEVHGKPLPEESRVVGIDLGLSTFATFSDGKTIKRQRWFDIDAKDIKRIQRKINQVDIDTIQGQKVIRAFNKAWKRVRNRRLNFAHQESRNIVNQYQIIAFEKLNIKNMQLNGIKNINKGISDVAWYQFVEFTTYKAEEAGRVVVKIDPKNTTQECSSCHSIVKKRLSDRIHDCSCGLKIDRDLNASLNILARGLASLQLC